MIFSEPWYDSEARLEGEHIYFRAQDDLSIYVRKYGGDNLTRRPLLCLAGLTRNGRDFHSLATALASHPVEARNVYCLDYRGRGRSQWDKDWHNYSPYTEMQDVMSFLALRGLANIAILGTSRGGIISLMLAVERPAAIGCAVLNDIGPAIETAGLARIMGYAGKTPVPRDWNEAVGYVREMFKRQFTALSDEEWEAFTRQLFNEESGRPAAAYDPKVGKALAEVDIAKPVPTMWEHFDTLLKVPVMVLRGENSDILSAATVQNMQERHRQLTPVLIRNEGHAPLLNDRFSQRLIADFLAGADSSWQEPKISPMPKYTEKTNP
jgi:pimeloyl-ACP methyl ester carboxylesterase